MNTLVMLRAVQDPAGFTVNRRAQKVFVNREDYLCNPSDRNALEAALRLGGAVTVVAFGAGSAEQVLRDALAAGASKAVLVKDDFVKSADGFVLTNVLRRVIEHIDGVDLVLLGAEVLDADLAQVGPRLAQALDWSFSEATHEVQASNGAATAIVRRADGFHRLQTDLPAVVSLAVHANKPRYAPGARVINVYRDRSAVEVLTAADLGLTEAETASPVEPRGESFPPERELGKRLEGSLEDVAQQLAEALRKT